MTTVNINQTKIIELKTFTFSGEVLSSRIITIQINYKTKIFLMIVILITSFVTAYREIYIEHYNNKKFFYTLVSFFLSIMFLSIRRGMINLIVGWEILGLRSLCLIIFYPNKTGKINSILTMVFNRIGDVLIIIILGIILIKYNMIFRLEKMSTEIIIIFIACRLTKRAQLPVSAWLPAAIAAPTPISAIVHSSTLVTAGILIIIRLHEIIVEKEIREILIYLRLIRFFIGGFMSNVEMDFKKMIAFSTIRQIRIIIYFSTFNIIEISIIHIFYHAFFKTLLFCTAGFIFIARWGEQKIKKNIIKNTRRIIVIIILIRIYRMTGIIYSVSFFTKDLFLEEIISSSNQKIIIIFILISSLITMFYRIKILKPLRKIEILKNFNFKKINSRILLILLASTLVLELFFKTKIFKDINPQLKLEEKIIIMIVLIVIPLIKRNSIKFSGTTILMTLEVAHMKFQIYSYWGKLIRYNVRNIILKTDMLFIKKKYFKSKEFEIITKRIYVIVLIIFFLALKIIYSISLRNIVLKKLKKKNIKLPKFENENFRC